jgi:platelet-activating factor acetylhydrolase
MDPFPSPGPEPYEDPSGPSPANASELFVINSEGFTLWTGHFKPLQETVKRFSPSRLLTIVRAQHISFSDFPLLVPRRFMDTDAQAMMDRIGLLAERFLEGKLLMNGPRLGVEDEKGLHMREMEVVKDPRGNGKDKWDLKLVGEPGDIILH